MCGPETRVAADSESRVALRSTKNPTVDRVVGFFAFVLNERLIFFGALCGRSYNAASSTEAAVFTDEPISITRRGRRARTYEPVFEALEPRMMLAAPTSPEPLKISHGLSAEIILSWHHTEHEDGYHIYRWSGGLEGTWRLMHTVPKDTTRFSLGERGPLGTDAFKIVAFNASGTEETTWKATTNSVAFNTNETGLTSPDNLFVIRRSSTQIDLTWTNVDREDGYRIHQVDRTSPRSIAVIATLDRDAGTPKRGILTHSLSISPSQVYYYIVEAFDNRGNQVYTNYAFALDGMIAYDTDSAGIHLMIADDSGQHKLKRLTDQRDYYPTWSPNGSEIAFVRDGGIYVMNADVQDK